MLRLIDLNMKSCKKKTTKSKKKHVLSEILMDCLSTITYEMRILINSKRKNLIVRDKLILFIGLIFFMEKMQHCQQMNGEK